MDTALKILKPVALVAVGYVTGRLTTKWWLNRKTNQTA